MTTVGILVGPGRRIPGRPDQSRNVPPLPRQQKVARWSPRSAPAKIAHTVGYATDDLLRKHFAVRLSSTPTRHRADFSPRPTADVLRRL